jgi:hypothetical protein
MKKLRAKITIRFVAAVLVTVAVIGLSGLAMHAPTQTQTSLSLKSIRTDKATLFYADGGNRGNQTWFVEEVLPGTSESKAATENLKLVATAL